MKAFNFILAILFMLFAFVQVNDPDPVLWILIYGAMAVLAVLAMFGIHPRRVILVLLIGYVAYSTVFFEGVKAWFFSGNRAALLDDVAKMEHWYIEEAREFLGLLICIIVLIFFYFRYKRPGPASA